MERGLFWWPLLALFFWLAWAGWKEYQKVEAYRLWAAGFDQAKYDIYAVLGQKGMELTWGKPTAQGPIELQSFSLTEVTGIQLWVDRQVVQGEPPAKGRVVELEFLRRQPQSPIRIPFTEIPLARKWQQYLQTLSQSGAIDPTLQG